MYEAILLDFYGTLVEEDTGALARITSRMADASRRVWTRERIATRWDEIFFSLCREAHGELFRRQRDIEIESVRLLLDECDGPLDAEELCAELFEYWSHPRPIAGARAFLDGLRLPVCIVSNIDAHPFDAALRHLGWTFDAAITSEGCRAYKPRGEPFEAALHVLGCSRDTVIHIGDSMSSDLGGAAAAGIDSAWINRTGRSLPIDSRARPKRIVAHVGELTDFLGVPQARSPTTDSAANGLGAGRV